jgi:phosphinothricin acetyltransferase
MDYVMSPISNEDRKSMMDIFNYYVENSYAAYPETKLPYEAFDMFLQMAQGYPTAKVKDKNGRVVGFGLLRSHNPIPVFSKTAEITYFIHSDHTGKGIGTKLLRLLEKEGMQKGITNILANISSLNPRSVDFHKKNGFIECGRFKNVGRKKGKPFDTVWMQKML